MTKLTAAVRFVNAASTLGLVFVLGTVLICQVKQRSARFLNVVTRQARLLEF